MHLVNLVQTWHAYVLSSFDHVRVSLWLNYYYSSVNSHICFACFSKNATFGIVSVVMYGSASAILLRDV